MIEEVTRGNVPSWLRTLRPVELHEGDHRLTFWVTPDYLSVGSDEDYLLIPLSPQSAQRLADLSGTSLPTTAMVDAVWRAARIKLTPMPIPPSDEMVTVPVFLEHNRIVRSQRDDTGLPKGELVAGHMKDVVITRRLESAQGKVAIYGWHQEDGVPIQPLYLGHTDRWVDYSHGIRLVHRGILVNGQEMDLYEVLGDPALARLLSIDGVIENPRYPIGADGRR